MSNALAEAIANQLAPWVSHAACRNADPELFFPEKGEGVQEAKRLCAECPVQDECLSHALDNNERFGVWGGLSERDRRSLRGSRGHRDLRAA